jgi:hypothetical protein
MESLKHFFQRYSNWKAGYRNRYTKMQNRKALLDYVEKLIIDVGPKASSTLTPKCASVNNYPQFLYGTREPEHRTRRSYNYEDYDVRFLRCGIPYLGSSRL